MLYLDACPRTAQGCKTTLSANKLKLIAVLAMVLDHSTTLFLPKDGFLSFALHAVGQVAAVSLVYVLQFYVHGSTLSVWLRPFVLLAIPLLMRYNHTLGRKSKLLQWGYYLFYPLHFVVLCVIQALIARS